MINDNEGMQLSEKNRFYKIKYEKNDSTIVGFIVKKYCNKPTLKAKSRRQHMTVLNGFVKPYCKVFISKKFNDSLQKTSDLTKALTAQNRHGEILLYSIFVGGVNRLVVQNPDIQMSDSFKKIHLINYQYFSFELSTHINDFFIGKLPNEIIDYKILNNQLIYTSSNGLGQNSLSYSNNEWILNDSINLIDISNYKTELHVNMEEIGDDYYYQILEKYLQNILGESSIPYIDQITSPILYMD